MKLVYLVLENRCNLKCPYCFYAQRGDKWTKERMGLFTVRSVLDQLASLGFTGVAFTGGEPTLHPDLLECIAHAKGRGYTTWLATNGTRLDEPLSRGLKDNGLDNVYLSSDTTDRTEIALISLERAMSMLRRAGLNSIHLTWVISRPDPGVLREVKAFARGHGVDVIFQPAWLAHSDGTLRPIAKEDITRMAPALMDWAREMHHIPYVKTVLRHYREGEKPNACQMGTNRIIVNWNGDMYPCFHRRDLKVGSVLTDSCQELIGRMREKAVPHVASAACFGEHCISLFA